MVLVWRIKDDSPNLPNFISAKLSCYTVFVTMYYAHIRGIIQMVRDSQQDG